MEVHTAFSRDLRGLVYDPVTRDFVEKETPPRYIDGLVVEQGQAICDYVISQKQGGLGGYSKCYVLGEATMLLVTSAHGHCSVCVWICRCLRFGHVRHP